MSTECILKANEEEETVLNAVAHCDPIASPISSPKGTSLKRMGGKDACQMTCLRLE